MSPQKEEANKSYWLRSGLYSFAQRLAILIFNFGGFYILVRTLPKSDFGVWSLFLTITALIEVARNGLIQNAQIKFGAAAKADEYPVILRASFTLNLLLSLVSVLFLCVSAPLFGDWLQAPELTPMLVFYSFTTLALIPFSQFNFVQQAQLDFKGIFVSTFVRQGIGFCVIALHWLLGIKLELLNLVWWQTFAAIAGAITGYQYVKPYLKISKTLNWDWVRKLFHFGKYVFGTNISATIFSSIDQVLLGALLNTSKVATYNATLKIINLIDVPISTIVSVVFPKSAQMVGEQGKEGLKYLYEKSVGLMLCIVIPVVLVVVPLSNWVMWLIAGPEYVQEGGMLLQITVMFSVIQPFVRQFGTIMDSIGKPQLNFLVILLIAFINTGLNYIFISWLGLIGAALGTLVAMCIFWLVALFTLRKIIKVSPWETIKYAYKFYGEGYLWVRHKLKV